MIRIGQIGIGHNHGAKKMETLRKFPELFQVVGFVPESEAWLEKRGDLPAYRDLPRLTEEALLASCDAVLVETEVSQLTETAQRCVDAGKHIMMDKPASGTLADFKQLLDTAEAKGLVVQLGYMYRYNPAVLKCLELIREGKLGTIHSIQAEMSANDPQGYKQWLSQFPGGGMYIFGSHLLDLAVYIMGEPERVHTFYKSSGKDATPGPDLGLTVLEYPQGLARIFTSAVEVNGYGRRQFVVCGTEGTVSIQPMERPTVMTYSDLTLATHHHLDLKRNIPVEELTADTRYDHELHCFHDYVVGKAENPWSYAHNYLVQKLLLEIAEAAT